MRIKISIKRRRLYATVRRSLGDLKGYWNMSLLNRCITSPWRTRPNVWFPDIIFIPHQSVKRGQMTVSPKLAKRDMKAVIR